METTQLGSKVCQVTGGYGSGDGSHCWRWCSSTAPGCVERSEGMSVSVLPLHLLHC